MVTTRSPSRLALATLLQSPLKRPYPQNEAEDIVPQKKMALDKQPSSQLRSSIPKLKSGAQSSKEEQKLPQQTSQSNKEKIEEADEWKYVVGRKGEEAEVYNAQCRRINAMSHEEIKELIRARYPGWCKRKTYSQKK
jgi:hypothetical protein